MWLAQNRCSITSHVKRVPGSLASSPLEPRLRDNEGFVRDANGSRRSFGVEAIIDCTLTII